MHQQLRGSALVEFALTIPVVISLVLPTIQLLGAAFLQTRLEVLAFRVARRLADESTPATGLSTAAENMTASLRPAVVSHARVRTLTTIPVEFPRRPRRVEIVEVDLAAEGPSLLAGFPIPLRAHAREFRWGAP